MRVCWAHLLTNPSALGKPFQPRPVFFDDKIILIILQHASVPSVPSPPSPTPDYPTLLSLSLVSRHFHTLTLPILYTYVILIGGRRARSWLSSAPSLELAKGTTKRLELISVGKEETTRVLKLVEKVEHLVLRPKRWLSDGLVDSGCFGERNLSSESLLLFDLRSLYPPRHSWNLTASLPLHRPQNPRTSRPTLPQLPPPLLPTNDPNPPPRTSNPNPIPYLSLPRLKRHPSQPLPPLPFSRSSLRSSRSLSRLIPTRCSEVTKTFNNKYDRTSFDSGCEL